MPRHARRRLTRIQKISAAVVAAAAGAASLAFSVVPSDSHTRPHSVAAVTVPVQAAAWDAASTGAQLQQDSVFRQFATADRHAKDEERARQRAAAQQAAEQARQQAAARQAQQAQQAEQARQAAERRAADARQQAEQAASRAAVRQPVVVAAPAAAAPAAVTAQGSSLDGWIRQALAVMARHGIPGGYNGIYRNVMRESGGNPKAINLWDSNAAKGTPSKGLLQVIQPTFNAYHVAGTSFDIYDPVANIAAACNYAAHVYGSIDNVNSAY